jgi:predicted nuclease of predicted toxin-antitoxin system
VKFLVDNQLPVNLAQHLRTRGLDCQHVLDVGLGEASDAEICQYAESQDRVIISKDEDFLHLASRPEAKISVLWVRLGNCRTSTLLAAFEKFWPVVESCINAGDRIIELR